MSWNDQDMQKGGFIIRPVENDKTARELKEHVRETLPDLIADYLAAGKEIHTITTGLSCDGNIWNPNRHNKPCHVH